MMVDLLPAAGPALVVGGGTVAARRIKLLNDAEFEVVVIAPEVAEPVRLAPHTTIITRPFEAADIDARPFALVFACTGDRATNQLVGELARQRRIPVVIADAAHESTAHTPATLRDGELVIAVSTGGASPALAKAIREKIAATLGPGWAEVVLAARRARNADTITHEDSQVMAQARAALAKDLEKGR